MQFRCGKFQIRSTRGNGLLGNRRHFQGDCEVGESVVRPSPAIDLYDLQSFGFQISINERLNVGLA